jgi:hypothetical protein
MVGLETQSQFFLGYHVIRVDEKDSNYAIMMVIEIRGIGRLGLIPISCNFWV